MTSMPVSFQIIYIIKKKKKIKTKICNAIITISFLAYDSIIIYDPSPFSPGPSKSKFE